MRWIDRLLFTAAIGVLIAIVMQITDMNGHLYEIRLHLLDLKNAAWAQANKP